MERYCDRVRSITLSGCWMLLLGCISPLEGQQNTYTGAQQCSPCHASVFDTQSTTGHARALHRAQEHPLAALFAPGTKLLRKPAYRFHFAFVGQQLRVQAFDAENAVDIPIEWAFGAGDQAVTFVTRLNEDWYLEHYYSYYPALRRLGPTPGHEALIPKTLQEAMGLPYRSLDPSVGIKGCFECHSTGPVSAGPRNEIQPAELGVRCEACHGAGSLHIEAAKAGETERASRLIQKPGRSRGAELNRFCGTCHRPPAGNGPAIDWNYAWNVRHQPVYLNQSACFQKSEGALTCLTCHDPHAPLRRNDAAAYNRQCRSCHTVSGTEARTPKAICETTNRANCIDCHMPLVSPQPGLRFSNHWIGIYKSGAKLKPEAALRRH